MYWSFCVLKLGHAFFIVLLLGQGKAFVFVMATIEPTKNYMFESLFELLFVSIETHLWMLFINTGDWGFVLVHN